MSEQPRPELDEERLREIAGQFSYPPTPDVAGRVRERLRGEGRQAAPRGRRLVWVALAVLLLILAVSVVAVPEVQALARAILRIGSVEIVVATPTPLQATVTANTPGATSPPVAATATPAVPAALRDLAGEMTLEQARGRVFFPIRSPAYPADLGEPDRVYLQSFGGQVVILAWLDDARPDKVRMTLWELSADTFAEKTMGETTVLQETTVNGRPAAWVSGPHMIRMRDTRGNEDWDVRRLVEGNVLVWEEGGITYRLETDLPLEEAVKVAESLK